MYPIEAVLSNSENKASYKMLSKNFENLIPYVGTGLSFYCKSWRAPFEGVLDALEESRVCKDFTRDLTVAQQGRWKELLGKNFPNEDGFLCKTVLEILNFIIGVINKTDGDKLETIEEGADRERIFEYFCQLLEKGCFLELGELLNAVSYVMGGETFNQKFHACLESYHEQAELLIKTDYEKIDMLGSEKFFSELPQSIWFLPYIGGRRKFIITTNCDDSIARVFYFLKMEAPNSYSGLNGVTVIKSDLKYHNIVYHIHGAQLGPNMDTTPSYIMTWSDYRRAYHKGEGSPQRILESYFAEGYFLFMGASLEQDVTMDKMRITAQKESAINRHVAFMVAETEPDKMVRFEEKLISLQNEMATQTITLPDFSTYSVVLCQLIRERRREWKVFSKIRETGFRVCKRGKICKEEAGCKRFPLCSSIDSFLESAETFQIYADDFSEDELIDNVYPALYKYLYNTRGERTYRWTVCRIDTDSFAFPIEQEIRNDDGEIYRLDTYSAPLGNTIYIIGGNRCNNEYVERLITKLKEWTQAHQEKNYWTQDVRIRVFKVSCTGELSPDEIIFRLHNIITNRDETNQKRQLIDLLKELRKYKMYENLFLLADNLERNLDTDWVLEYLLINISAMFTNLQEKIKKLQSIKVRELYRKKVESGDLRIVIRGGNLVIDSGDVIEHDFAKILTLGIEHPWNKER